MATREFTVECAEHGAMVRDLPGAGFRCEDEACGAFLADDDVHGRVTASLQDQPGPARVIVEGGPG